MEHSGNGTRCTAVPMIEEIEIKRNGCTFLVEFEDGHVSRVRRYYLKHGWKHVWSNRSNRGLKPTAGRVIELAKAKRKALIGTGLTARPKTSAMARYTTKVFAGIECQLGNPGKQVRIILATVGRAKAVKLLAAAGVHVTIYRMTRCWTSGSEAERALALSAPGQVFATSDVQADDYHPLLPAAGAAPPPLHLTFKIVNRALAQRPGWAGEELISDNGLLRFSGGNTGKWRATAIQARRLKHTTLESILANFDQFVTAHEPPSC